MPESAIPNRIAAWIGAAALATALSWAACSGPRRPARRTLTVVQSSDILTLDPNEKFEVVNDTVAMNLFDPLLRFDQHMNLQPWLAVRWENPDELTWRLHLRPGVRFHDGSPLSAQDVVFSLRRVMSRPSSEIYPFLAGVREVRALSPDTVEITTVHPMALLSRLSYVYILPRRLLDGGNEAAFFRNPVGTGPYRFVRRQPGLVELRSFDDYWGGRPTIAAATFRAAETAAETWSLAEQPRPTIVLDAPRKDWEQKLRQGRLRLIARPGLTVSYLGVNVSAAGGNPLADVRVRQALRRTIDLPRLIREGLDGHAFPASQYVPPDVVGYNPDLAAPAPDPAASRRLLGEAGYPNGVDLSLDVEEGTSEQFESELAREAAAGGFRLVPRAWDKAEFFDRIDTGRSALHLTGWICSSGDSAELFESSLHTRRADSELGRDNGTGYSNPRLDAIIEQISSTMDPARRVSLEQRAMAVAMADLPYIPLLIAEDRYAMTPEIQWEPRADGEIWLPAVGAR
jgi:peptide/nickel transport system substrate-binding protein